MSVVEGLMAAFATNDRINQYMVRGVPDAVWGAKQADGKGRSIAKIFAHMHNVRLMWLGSIEKGAALPAKLDGDEFPKETVLVALDESRKAIGERLAAALEGDGRVKGFKPDAASFFAYLVAHDAHHRGQVALQAKQLGHPLPKTVLFGLWEWGVR